MHCRLVLMGPSPIHPGADAEFLAEATGEVGRVGPADLRTDGCDGLIGRGQQDRGAFGATPVGPRDGWHADPALEQPHEMEGPDAQLAGKLIELSASEWKGLAEAT